jgi:bacteriocin biosynthesis cyclodehydratase domain-containing protein
MTISLHMRPLLPSCYYILYEPPDEQGDESLLFVSQRRRIKIKGTMLREFKRAVAPLLDGRHSVAEIEASVAGELPPGSVSAALQLLEDQNLLIADAPEQFSTLSSRLAPQLNFFHELGLAASEAQKRLSQARVSVLALGGLGSLVAVGLAAAGVGRLGLIDDLPVREADGLHSPIYTAADLGKSRASAVKEAIEARFSSVSVDAMDSRIETEAQIAAAIDGADFVACCVDSGESGYRYKLNRVCKDARIPWMTCEAAGFEGIVGPTVRSGETACYLCYTMRSVALARDPEEDFNFQQFLDSRRTDDGDRRESLGFAAGLVANLAGIEILKSLVGLDPLQTDGAILVVDFLRASMRRHVVLRNPRCPVCFPSGADDRKEGASVAVETAERKPQ